MYILAVYILEIYWYNWKYALLLACTDSNTQKSTLDIFQGGVVDSKSIAMFMEFGRLRLYIDKNQNFSQD